MGAFFMERKTKFSISFKETVVREYLHGITSSEELFPSMGFRRVILDAWPSGILIPADWDNGLIVR